jgi:tetraacyldisaccharide 4'-kinase
MRPPEFWNEDGKRAYTVEVLLAPISAAYAWIDETKRANAKPERVPRPVLCVGNVTLGGVGKTPIVRAIAKRLRASGVEAHVLSRGYGGSERGPLRVTASHDAKRVGDEPLLHAQDGPAWIAHDRVAGAKAMIAAGAQSIVMDDGFQNPSLAKDVSLLVFDARQGLGNRRTFPSGPLREKLEPALARAQGVILVGEGETPWLTFNGPILRAQLAPSGAPPHGKLVAFAGIGRPEKFFDTLENAGGAVVEEVPYPDHHDFSRGDLQFLEKLALERAATLITTEKDFVRLPAAWRTRVATLPIEATFQDEAPLNALLAPIREAR